MRSVAAGGHEALLSGGVEGSLEFFVRPALDDVFGGKDVLRESGFGPGTLVIAFGDFGFSDFFEILADRRRELAAGRELASDLPEDLLELRVARGDRVIDFFVDFLEFKV